MCGVKRLKILVLSVTISSFFFGCKEQATSSEIHGETQGTTYTIILADDVSIDQHSVDSILKNFDNALSTYIDTSLISRLNNSSQTVYATDEHGFFQRCYKRSAEIYELSQGAFDPSVYPLVEGWGFMQNMETPLSKSSVDSILNFVSFQSDLFHSVSFNENELTYSKRHLNFRIDFNAIAQGLAVDIIDEYLSSRGCKNYYVEIGGEISVKGKNADGVKWRIGVDTPIENLESRELENILHVTNKAIATSGNYRKFYEYEGVKYAHTLDPKTGFPVQHSLLSATVIANDCQSADAFATVFMVLGVDKSLAFVNEHPDQELEVYLLYADEKGNIQRKMSDGFQVYLEE